MFPHRCFYRTLAAILLVGVVFWGCQPVSEPPPADMDSSGSPILTGDYLGQEPPEMEPQLFAPGIVSTGLGERDVAMTPDGKYLFFMSSRATIQNRFSPVRQSYDSLQDLHNQPMNGSFDIWWIDARIIDELRPEGF